MGLGFFDMFRFGGGGADAATPLLSSLFVDLSQGNFVQQLTIKALAQIWKRNYKNNDAIDNDVIIVKILLERQQKVSILKSMLLLHFLFSPTETLQKH